MVTNNLPLPKSIFHFKPFLPPTPTITIPSPTPILPPPILPPPTPKITLPSPTPLLTPPTTAPNKHDNEPHYPICARVYLTIQMRI